MTESVTKPAHKLKTVALILLGVLAVVVVIRLLPGGPGPSADSRTVLEREWESAEVLGLTLSSPGRFRLITVPVPENIRTSIEKMESSGRNVGQTELRVTRIEYLPGVALNVDSAAQGAVDAMRQNPAVAGLAHSHARTQVSGIPAVRTTSEFRVGDKPGHGEILTLLRGRTLWQVQVLGPSDATPEIARRLMESVRLQP